MSNLENLFSSRQQGLLADRVEFALASGDDSEKIGLYSSLLELDKLDLKILEVAGRKPNIKSRDLEQELNLSRSPVLKRTKNLEQRGMLVRSIVPGAEHRNMPPQMVSLPPDVSLVAIECAMKGMSLREYLELGSFKEELRSVPLPAFDVAYQNGKVSKNSTSVEAMGEVLRAAVEKIAELEVRLAQVEKALRDDSFDRDECLSLLRGNATLSSQDNPAE